MATTPSHGVQAGLLAYYCLKFLGMLLRVQAPSLWTKLVTRKKSIVAFLIGLAAFLGMLPDLIGMYGHSHAALAAREQGDTSWLSARDWSAPQGYYWRAHYSDLYEAFKLVPFYSLHIWVDKFFHKEGGGWNTQGYVLEVIVDVLMIGLIGFELNRMRRNRT